jgi:hypothetical protein
MSKNKWEEYGKWRHGEEPDKETQRELITQIIQADEKDGLYDI